MLDIELLINKLVKSGALKTPKIIEAFKQIDRINFVKSEYSQYAYDDRPLSIDFGQTISQPTTVAFMLEKLQPEEGEKILDVGSGSGWTTALLAYLVGENGLVIGIERVNGLVEYGQGNLAKYEFVQAKIINAEDKLGLEAESPFDKILVSASARELPEELIEQLKEGGVLVMPVRNSIYKITKTAEGYEKDEYYGFSFVPLIE